MKLQEDAADLARRGIGLAAISYDRRDTLKAFADARGITFPLLSDAGSVVIKRYGLLNTAATGRTAGVPHPGTFVLDARGVVISRAFEEAYQERQSAASVLTSAPDGIGPAGGATTETRHATITTSLSDATAAPGTRVSLIVSVHPKPSMHVYAPGQKDLIPITLTLEANDTIRVHEPSYPPAETYLFEPLNETQLVYSHPFRIVQDVTVPVTPATRERSAARDAVTITGSLRYQACDDAICYLPVTVPVSWTLALTPLER